MTGCRLNIELWPQWIVSSEVETAQGVVTTELQMRHGALHAELQERHGALPTELSAELQTRNEALHALELRTDLHVSSETLGA